MPIVAPRSSTFPTTTPTGLLTIREAARLVARAIGGANDVDVLDEAEDNLLAAMEDLNIAWDWDFLRKTTTISISAGTADYDLPTDFRAVYTARLTSNARHLVPFRQRDYDRATWTQTSGTPVGYNLYPSSTVEALDPQHTKMSIRLIPTPSSSDTLSIKYYRRTVVYTALGMTLDVPRQFQYWAIYQAKSMLLADHGAEFDRAAFWQRKANKMLALMKNDDQSRLADDTPSFVPDDDGFYDYAHPQTALWMMDGF